MSPSPARAFCALLVIAAASCAAKQHAFRLVDPPTVPDQAYPGAHRLVIRAPLAEWQSVGGFPSRTACEEARRIRTEAAVERAHATTGEEAKYDLDLRRAVNARCVRNR